MSKCEEQIFITEARQTERKENVVGAPDTDGVNQKHNDTENGQLRRISAALVYSVRRVSEYSSSLRSILADLTARERGI